MFGEVFLNEAASKSFVLKIIPIEGEKEVNGAQQKRFDEILQEVIISQELSNLRYSGENRTAGFVEVLNVRLVEGRYPEHLIDLWKTYADNRGTENDSPSLFDDDQLYVVFELANAGADLEAFVFKNAEQSFSILQQVNTKFSFGIKFFVRKFNCKLVCMPDSSVLQYMQARWMGVRLVHIVFMIYD